MEEKQEGSMNFIQNKSVSQYQKTEDRVSAELLKILYYGGYDLIAYLFGEDFDLPSNKIEVDSQVYGGGTRPDGLVACDCKFRIFIECKIIPNAVVVNQLQGHCQKLTEAFDYLLYITPDKMMPKELQGLYHVFWINWDDLVQKLENYAQQSGDRLLIYLVEEIKITIKVVVYGRRNKDREDKLTTQIMGDDANERVIIVGGRWGENIALKYNRYICQPNRFFLPAKYLTFCYDNRIRYLFEIKEKNIEEISLKDPAAKLPPNYFTDTEPNYKTSDKRKVMFLELVKEFGQNIDNNTMDKNGKRCAFVQRQRYTTYNKIINAKKTSDLI